MMPLIFSLLCMAIMACGRGGGNVWYVNTAHTVVINQVPLGRIRIPQNRGVIKVVLYFAKVNFNRVITAQLLRNRMKI